MLAIGDKVVVEWTWGGSRFNAAGVVTKVSGKTVKVRLTEHAGEHFAPGFIVTAQAQNVRKDSNMQTTRQAPRMDAFTRQYFETALWSSTDESDDQGGEPLDKNYGVGDIADETRWQMIADCADFQKRFGHLYDDSEQAGHDFWLSRNGHGTGFFDRDTEHADELQTAAKSYGEFDLYVGDDGEIHGTPIGAPGRDYQKVRSSGRHVADFNTLDDLIEHAAVDLGAKYVSGTGAGTRFYFSSDDPAYKFEVASVWQKGGYWHAQGPSARTLTKHLPRSAVPIAGRRAARHTVRDYEAVDNHDRHIAGPFKSYGDARQAAGTAGVVKFVPTRGKRASETRSPSRSAHTPTPVRRR